MRPISFSLCPPDGIPCVHAANVQLSLSWFVKNATEGKFKWGSYIRAFSGQSDDSLFCFFRRASSRIRFCSIHVHPFQVSREPPKSLSMASCRRKIMTWELIIEKDENTKTERERETKKGRKNEGEKEREKERVMSLNEVPFSLVHERICGKHLCMQPSSHTACWSPKTLRAGTQFPATDRKV